MVLQSLNCDVNNNWGIVNDAALVALIVPLAQASAGTGLHRICCTIYHNIASRGEGGRHQAVLRGQILSIGVHPLCQLVFIILVLCTPHSLLFLHVGMTVKRNKALLRGSRPSLPCLYSAQMLLKLSVLCLDCEHRTSCKLLLAQSSYLFISFRFRMHKPVRKLHLTATRQADLPFSSTTNDFVSIVRIPIDCCKRSCEHRDCWLGLRNNRSVHAIVDVVKYIPEFGCFMIPRR
mmetsp:Transcript_26123/g.49625  ORF Transcript_26123/g.49625 Transcript_26123/m.49625 type:complete len:234 (+) Transcript_26123:213-914(+)